MNTYGSSPSSQATAADAATFGVSAEARIRSAQEAVLGLIEDAGLQGARASDLARALKLDKTLAWKVVRFAESQSPAAAFKHLPGMGGVEIVVKAAGSAGVTTGRLDAVRDADRELRGFVKRHAGDRRTFEAMLSGAIDGARAQAEERRAFYRAGSVIWGVRASAQFLTLALRPSETDPTMLDCVQVSGFIDLERLRHDLPWVIRRLRVHADDGSPTPGFSREPLDPAGVTGSGDAGPALSLLPDFCTAPLPVIRQRIGHHGWLYDELSPGDIGRKGAVTVVAGEVYRAALPLARSEENTEGRYILTVRTPLEHVQLDLLLHPALGHFRWPMMSAIGSLQEHGTGDGFEVQSPTPAEQLTGAITSPVVPDYGRLVADALARAGWGDPGSYRAYRATMEYPPAPCEVRLVSELGGN